MTSTPVQKLMQVLVLGLEKRKRMLVVSTHMTIAELSKALWSTRVFIPHSIDVTCADMEYYPILLTADDTQIFTYDVKLILAVDAVHVSKK